MPSIDDAGIVVTLGEKKAVPHMSFLDGRLRVWFHLPLPPFNGKPCYRVAIAEVRIEDSQRLELIRMLGGKTE